MYQRAIGGDVIDVFTEGFDIIDEFGAWAGEFLDDAFGFAAVELDLFAFVEFTGINKILTIDAPKRVIRSTTDRL